MNNKLILTIGMFLLSGKSFACENITSNYFAWAGLKTVPASVGEPLTEFEAKQRHESGAAYYKQTICESGQVKSLTKYYAGKVFFHTEYSHEVGGILITTTNSEGKVAKHHAK
ncbi:hypothetical protein ACFOEK_20755 [Litoribrevibacter euphylliae]|uniref:Uncharacterized protein n=1 Tax=Litoribrevibacter euphylliae TaxID=1834034 RepID=A0ABV7HIL7_9GAMM